MESQKHRPVGGNPGLPLVGSEAPTKVQAQRRPSPRMKNLSLPRQKNLLPHRPSARYNYLKSWPAAVGRF
jgi:hypothetical protein